MNGGVVLNPAEAKVVLPAPLLVKYSTVWGAVPFKTVAAAVIESAGHKDSVVRRRVEDAGQIGDEGRTRRHLE